LYRQGAKTPNFGIELRGGFDPEAVVWFRTGRLGFRVERDA
jgi:hypothetical protein